MTLSTGMPRVRAWSATCFFIRSVYTYPGQTALTVTPERAVSRAAVLVKPATPCFAALYLFFFIWFFFAGFSFCESCLRVRRVSVSLRT